MWPGVGKYPLDFSGGNQINGDPRETSKRAGQKKVMYADPSWGPTKVDGRQKSIQKNGGGSGY